MLEQSDRCLRAYVENPTLIEEHSNIERSTTQGGYGHRQLYELVQNGADELQREPGGGIQVVLGRNVLYCANLGTAVTPEGVETILASHLSRKRGTEIGRFGLGFKSVLSVSTRPQFFSRSGSFGWDADQTRRAIRRRVPGDGPTPVLRLAHLLDSAAERQSDPVLAELMSWATTVIKLPLGPGHVARLGRDIREFPAKFAIFSPHVGELILEDRRDPNHVVRREIYVKEQGATRTLFTDEGGHTQTSEWMVFETVHVPTARAKRDAGEYHDRSRIPLAWAVPTSGQQGTGEFWAFFPTTYETTLRGVLNAPWKTNEDRQNLLKNNSFNEELMEVAANLVVDSLPALSTPQDPARHLTLITARGREARNWADEMLTTLVYKAAAVRPSLPDQTGALRKPAELKLHPERLDKKWLRQWAEYPGRPMDWCHHSVEETTRRSRAEIILERAGRGPANVRVWLEALVEDGTVAASIVALSIVADMVQRQDAHADDARRARILRTESGEFVEPIADTVFRRTALDVPSGDLPFVDADLAADQDADWALTVLGIREADALGRFAAMTKQGFAGYGGEAWERFWLLARAPGADRAVRLLAEQGVSSRALRVKVRSGVFRPFATCLLPGRVVQPGSPDDHDIAVDLDFHQADVGMLQALGMTEGPRVSVDPTQEPWYAEYRAESIEAYYKRLPAGTSRPRDQSMVVQGPSPAGPLELLPRLSPAARARFLMSIPSVGLAASWTVTARTRGGDHPVTVPSPLVWMARRHGVLPTLRGLRSVAECVGPALSEHRDLLPVAEVDAGLAAVLRLPGELAEISGEMWLSILEEVLQSEDDARVGGLYALGEPVLSAPDRVRCRMREGWTSLSPDDVAVAADREQYQRLIAHDVPSLLAPSEEAAMRLVSGWGLSAFVEALVTELRVAPAAAATPLEDAFPQLRFLPGRPVQGLQLVRCAELDELISTPTGQSVQPMDIGRDDATVYWREIDDDFTLLRRLSRLLSLGLNDDRCRQVLKHREEALKSKQVVAIRSQKDDVDRLKTMLPTNALRERLPRGLVEHVEKTEGRVDERTIAELAISVHGPATLREYRSELETAGFALPTQMAGGHQAVTFVSDLGFSAEFAGFATPTLEPTLTVEGPVDFPPLHRYQEEMVGRMREVLVSSPPQRGMLSLPTGAGKTRVAVEALTNTLRELSPDRESVPVLWIAQSEELCEQAVQSWHFVWKAMGPAKRLTISRLWNRNETHPVTDGFHLVIATDAKLEKVLETEDYAWLRAAQAVVVDEAHTSLSPRYTRVLAALGLTPHRTRCPFIGLTATPFRGNSTEETDRLVNRYGQNRLDHYADGTEILGEDPYLTLQNLGVLARVRHQQLEGAQMHLEAEERQILEQLRRLPSSVEESLGQNQQRNQTLLDTIKALPEGWPILLFATSVNHAKLMAALLTREGIRAAAISGDTEIGVRRHIIHRFRKGEVRVLANYGVLSQGFDAPATRAVIVARPTYSPNVYQQMIGRGLRGKENGGKDECLIVNVADNIDKYGEELAFRRFEYLWKNQ
ncbi:DEAD/DEAH box helicase family protein [Streptomyces sp. NPDC020719]|uniref:DEAD/DEAH box helicase n=1 Tax=Streptomyces sp. NPDC020719 TaxID=3154896 RepID=UPI0033E81806